MLEMLKLYLYIPFVVIGTVLASCVFIYHGAYFELLFLWFCAGEYVLDLVMCFWHTKGFNS